MRIFLMYLTALNYCKWLVFFVEGYYWKTEMMYYYWTVYFIFFLIKKAVKNYLLSISIYLWFYLKNENVQIFWRLCYETGVNTKSV
uniref:Uncharacterized protein n=1 Tax=Anguilla anguilla TaxID=7936 RepID=A0A0E9S5U4_ANGAN